MSTRSDDAFTTSLLVGVGLVTAAVLLLRPSVDFGNSVELVQCWPLFIVVLAFAQMVATIKSAINKAGVCSWPETGYWRIP